MPDETKPVVIDAHHHFWRYTPEEYGWIPGEWTAIRRDFLPPDLAAEMASAGVDGVVTVQARQTVQETEWLLEMAAEHVWMRGVVGWAPLVSDDLPRVLDGLDALPGRPKLKGLRHVLQGEDDSYMARPEFDRGLAETARRGLVYDILIYERQLPAAIALADRHPDATFVLDHLAKPKIAAGEIEPWASRLRELARRENVACKVSGMVTEADVKAWTPDALRRYFDAALEAFGPGRLMFGSDWPVCLAGVGYARWREIVGGWVSGLSPDEQTAILGGNAVRWYRL